MAKIAILIPATSKGRSWKNVGEVYLYVHTLKSFFLTYNKEHEYCFYIGIDSGDPIYDNPEIKQYLTRFVQIMKNTNIQFIYMDGITKGHLTIMWNRLFEKAYADGYDYFFQCGDDISFRTNGWVNDCIKALANSGGIGMAGPINNNSRILTQSFVSRRHMELFGYYFPPEIINWCCDDWINDVYKGLGHFYPLKKHYCANAGGEPRYVIHNDEKLNSNIPVALTTLRSFCSTIVQRDLQRVFASSSATK